MLTLAPEAARVAESLSTSELVSLLFATRHTSPRPREVPVGRWTAILGRTPAGEPRVLGLRPADARVM